MRLPYIGVTGFTARKEVLEVLNYLPYDSNRILMVGALVSSELLEGKRCERQNRYPTIGGIAGAFTNDLRALNLVHYNTKDRRTLVQQLVHLTKLGGQYMDGFQLNIAWPSCDAIRSYRKLCSGKFIILQIGARALSMINNSPEELADRVNDYRSIVDHILIDSSDGLGKPFDTDKVGAQIESLKRRGLNMGLGVAGGLGPVTLSPIEALIVDFPELSWDAESKLRNSSDKLVPSVAGEYVSRSAQLALKAGK